MSGAASEPSLNFHLTTVKLPPHWDPQIIKISSLENLSICSTTLLEIRGRTIPTPKHISNKYNTFLKKITASKCSSWTFRTYPIADKLKVKITSTRKQVATNALVLSAFNNSTIWPEDCLISNLVLACSAAPQILQTTATMIRRSSEQVMVEAIWELHRAGSKVKKPVQNRTVLMPATRVPNMAVRADGACLRQNTEGYSTAIIAIML